MSYSFRRARLVTRSKRQVSRVLAFAFLLSLISVPIFSKSAKADTAGSGTCQQTYTTNSGTGTVTVLESGGYCYVAFKNTGALNSQTTFTWTKPTSVTTANVLVVGGGGGGGAHVGAGGGAGGFRDLSSVSLSNTSSVVVGAGGSAAFTSVGGDVNQGSGVISWSFSGKASSFAGAEAAGGGRGAFWWNDEVGSTGNGLAENGGSGGGAVDQTNTATSGGTGNTPSTNPVQGYSGGSAGGAGIYTHYNGYLTGGGGGAGASGNPPSHSSPLKSGDGGIGKSTSWISSSVAAALGVGEVISGTAYFAGGGGGGFHTVANGWSQGLGGYGGGGDGIGPTYVNEQVTGDPGAANTGGGGGGSGAPSTGTYKSTGGAGGSGVVVVRYQSTFNVTYNSNGGSAVASDTFTIGGSIAAAPIAPTLSGYRFSGWSATNGGSIISFPYSPGVATDITLYANWIGVPFLSYNSSDLNSFSSSGTSVTDLSANGFNATTIGSVGFDSSTGASSGSWSFPGGTNAAGPYIDVSNMSSNYFSSGFTIDFEADFGSQKNGFERIIDFGEGGQENDNIIVSRDGTTSNLFLEVWRGNVGSRCTYINGITEGVLTRYTVTVNGSTCRVFKNAAANPDYSVSYSTLPVSGLTLSDNFIGKSNWSPDSQYEGRIRSLRIYASAFTPAQIDSFDYKTLTFNSSGGTATGITSGVTSGKLKLAASPTLSGYTFNGWYDASTGGNLIGAASAEYTPTTTSTLYAQWSGNQYSYNANTGSNPPADQTYAGSTLTAASGSSVTAPSGYTFNGWCTTQPSVGSTCSGTSYAAGDNLPTPSSSTVTLYAIWSQNSFTYTFDSNSGSAVTGGSYNYGESIAKPSDPTLNNKYFGGWSTSETNNQGDLANRISTWPYSPGNQNVTLYAIWHDDFSLTLAGTNGASARVGTVASKVSLIPSSSSFSWEAWIKPTGFAGTGSTKWSTVLDNLDDGNNYGRVWLYVMDSGSGPYISSGYYTTGGSGNNVITAANSISLNTWQHVAVTIDRSATSLTNSIYINGVLSQSNTVSLSGSLNSVGFSIGDNYDDANQQFKGQIDQVKIWSGVLTPAEVATSRTNYSNSNIDNTLLAHYSFNDLSSAPALNNVVDNVVSDSSTYNLSIYAASSANVTSNVTRTQNSFSVSFDGNSATSGSVSSESAKIPYSTISIPSGSALSRTGYTFSTWNITAGGSGTNYAPADSYQVLYGDATLFAKWTANTNTVTFNSNYGTPTTTTQSITTDVSTALTANSFTRTGYTFSGWNTAANGSGTDYSNSQSVTINSDLTLYAKWSANSNTVTFNSNYGTSTTSTQSITSGSATSLTSNSFTRAGYTFAGWNTLAGGGGTSYTNGQSVTIYAPFTLYAQWTEIQYTVTYDKNGASGAPEKSSEIYGIDSTGALSLSTTGTMTRTGYTFDGWYTAASGGSKIGNASASYTPTANITLYARWNAASYSITFNSTGSTSGSAPSTLTYTTGGSAVTIPNAGTLAKSGYTFSKWNTRADGLGTDYAIGASLTTAAPVVLHPIWSAISYSITYSTQNSTSGSAPTDATVYNIGDIAYIKANTSLVRTGYTFAGWTIAQDNSGTVNQSGDSYTFGAGSITLYPKWTANTYNITYNANGATGTPARTSDTYTTGDPAVTLPGRGTMAKTGYTFTGWSTSPTGIGQATATTTSDVTLYAIWDLNRYQINFNRGMLESITLNGSYVATFPANTEADYNSTITLGSNPTDVSSNVTVNSNLYQFFGWNDGNTIYTPGQSFRVGAASPTFTAEWIRLYEVRYALNGGTGIVDIDSECTQANNTCLANQAITLSSAPTKTGYTFTGWKDQANNSFAAGAATTVTNTSFVYYAQWTPVDYSITFDSIGGSNSPATETKNIGQTVTLPSPGTRTGYDFSGWTLGGVTYGVGTTYTVGSTNASFTALWTAKRFNVSYDWNGGVGTPTPSSIYTYGNAAITLPTGSSHTKDGYIFNGWKDQDGNTIGTTHTPTQDTRYVAQWIDGSYTITYNTVGGTLAQSSVSVARTTATTLPNPTRANYTFDGWYEDSNNTVLYGQAAASVTPTSSRTLYAKWVQDSLLGINPAHLNSLATITVTGAHTWSGSHSLSGTGAALSIPNGALPNGTVVSVSFVEDLTRPASLINANYAYYTSVVLHWQLGTGSSATVPVAAAGKPLALTLTNPDIREGAKIYKIIRGVATEVATATQDGQVTINVYEDPEIVVAATTPTAPLSVTALGNLNGQSTVSWTAPASSGGAEVTSYTVTSSPGNQTCTATGTTSCTVSGLTNDSTYTFTVVANNAVGSSVASAASGAIIPRLRPTFNATFDSKGGSSVSDTLFNNADGIAQPSTPTKSGYTFAGWFSTDGDASTLVTFPYSPNVNNDVTLYAYWTATAASSGGGVSASVPTVSPIINTPAVSRVNPSTNTPLINMPAAPAPITAPISKFPELQNAPYPTNGLNVPSVGEVVTLIDRVPVQPVITTQQNQTVIEFGDSIALTLAPKTTDGQTIPTTTDGVVRVLQGSVIEAAGTGFKAGSPVEAWVYSTPTRLGSGIADSNGEFEQSFKIADEFKLGKHTIVLNGLTPKNEIFTVALGIQVVDQIPLEVQPDLEDGSNLLIRAVQILVFLTFLFVLRWLVRRPRKH